MPDEEQASKIEASAAITVCCPTEEADSTMALGASQVGDANETSDSTEKLPKCYPHCCGTPLFLGNKEALAWAVDTTGRAVSFVAAGAFLAPALIRLAKEAAGCVTEPLPSGEVPECEGRVYGLRPSSLLTTYTIVVGVSSAALMPLMGSIVDYTKHRRLLGRVFAFLACIFMFPQIFIGENTFFMVAILQIIVAFVGWGHTMLSYAYLPELTNDEKALNKLTSQFTMVNFGSMVLYLGALVGITMVAGIQDDDVATARLGMAVAFVITMLSYIYAWRTFDVRPAARELPEGASIWTEGFKQIYCTGKRIRLEFKSLKWFYIAVAFGDAGVQSLASIATTYLIDVLLFSSFENGISLLVLLICSIPGGFLSGWFIARYENAKWSSMIATSIMIANTFLASAILTGPGQQLRAYGVSGLWGLGTGWKWSSDKLMSSTLIPGGQDAELMGLFLFAGQCLTWLPPLIYTALNEAGLNQRINIATLTTYFFLSVLGYACMGTYKEAVEIAKANREEAPAETKEV